MKPFPIPVVGLGPGSQPSDPELEYIALPREIDGFDMPYLPTAEEVVERVAAKAVIAELIARLKDYDGNAENYPVIDISHLGSDDRMLINQLLGEGEVSAMVKPVAGGQLEIQESVFAGIWRALQSDEAGRLLSDRIEACPIPREVWQEAERFGSATLVAPDTQGVPLMNALPVVEELRDKLAAPPDEAHVINFSLLPMTPDDMAYIDAVLGQGNSGVFSRGYGKCRVLSTRLQGVWRVQYFNGMNAILLDTLEVCRMPEVTLAATDDLQDALERLVEAYDWLTAEDA